MPIELYQATKRDSNGACVRVDNITGMVRVDGVPVFKVKILQSGDIVLQFADPNKVRSEGRGTRYIEVPLEVIVEKIKTSCL